MKVINLTGRKFGRLTVLRRTKSTRFGMAVWLCECRCGRMKAIRSTSLQLGCTKSCGCLRKELSGARFSAMRGNKNPNWAGGLFKTQGYVREMCREHPRAGPKPYVFQHILVMEKVLGRYLLPGETVHHKNGIRNDNRPENLELWTRNHPSGQRVIDKIECAKQLLQTYEPGALR